MYIVLQSYSSIEYAINLYYKYKEQYKVKIIIFNNENIKRFLLGIGIDPESIIFYKYSIKFTKNIFSYINQLLFRRKFLIKNIYNIKNSIIYIFNRNECLEIFDMFYRIKNKNEIRYVNFDPNLDYNNSAKEKLKGIAAKTFYLPFIKVKYRVFNQNGYIFTQINMQELYTMNYRTEDVQDMIGKIINIDVKGKLLIMESTDLAAVGVVHASEMAEKSKFLIEIIRQLYNGNYLIKPHPMFNKLYFDEQESNIVENYIPFEYLLKCGNFKVVIGIMSTTLIHSSLENTYCVVSIIYLIEFVNNNEKLKIIEWLDRESGSKIKFPKTIDELYRILNQAI